MKTRTLLYYNRFFILCFFGFIGFHSFSQGDTRHALFDVISKLREDVNHQFLKTLKPSPSDCNVIFLNDTYAQRGCDYANEKWSGIESVPDDSMKPKHKTDKVKVLAATKQELAASKTNGLPKAYNILAKYIKDDVVVYGFMYLNDDGSEQKTRAAFFYVNDKWIIIPRTFKAFE
ncbi:hypothetical protein [Aestuariivivens sediminis]|uniref:hypothetical protein n=1 Tax=Aestuariivivens sediminis TaxID=2913557 RepID=UPI001F5737F0|nr:hypothetical protein [Aestuariivivens sediminis]